MKHVSLEHIGSSVFGDTDTSMYEFEIELKSSSLTGSKRRGEMGQLVSTSTKNQNKGSDRYNQALWQNKYGLCSLCIFFIAICNQVMYICAKVGKWFFYVVCPLQGKKRKKHNSSKGKSYHGNLDGLHFPLGYMIVPQSSHHLLMD
jgi:hypothetical protein